MNRYVISVFLSFTALFSHKAVAVTAADAAIYCTVMHPQSKTVFIGRLISDIGIDMGTLKCREWAIESGFEQGQCSIIGCKVQYPYYGFSQ